MAPPPPAATFAGRLLAHAAAQPHKAAFTFLDDAGRAGAAVTYAQLEQRSRALAAHLLAPPPAGLGLRAGERLLLVFLPSLDFIVAFIACLRAGVVAVPVYPPDPRRTKAHVGAFASVARSSGAAAVLTHPAYERAVSLAQLRESATALLAWLRPAAAAAAAAPASAWPELPWHSVEPLGRLPAATAAAAATVQLVDDRARPDALAFLQYTSGSTAEPKGVMVTHGNLAHNLAAIVRALRAGADTVVVSWLPQYHDMGLIGSYLGAAYCGGRGVYMSPLAFIKRPVGWLEAVHAHRGTHLQSPNFGYALAARKWRELQAAARPRAPPPALDLSCVRHMFNAAEPVTSAAMRDFVDALRATGLAPGAMRPGYGLAEHTVYVCDGGRRVLTLAREPYEARGEAVVLASTPVDGLAGAAPAPRAAAAAGDAGPSPPAADGGGGSRTTGVLEVAACGPVTSALHAPAHPADRADDDDGDGDGTAPRAPADDIRVAIVDPVTCTPVADGRVGEVWVASPSVAAGYWGLPELSARTFRATLAVTAGTAAVSGGEPAPPDGGSPPAPCHFLRTGDLGFLHDGELFISGRQKDLLIVRGRNFFPQDLEATVEADPRLRPGCTAVFQAWVPSPVVVRGSVSEDGGGGGGGGGGAEGVVVAAELRDPGALSAAGGAITGGSGGGEDDGAGGDGGSSLAGARAVVAALRAAVMRDHGLALSSVVLLVPHAARKTTSGKIARQWSLRAFQALVSPRGAATTATAAAGGSAPVPAAATSPWARTGVGANVVHLWLAPSVTAAEELEEAEEEKEVTGEGGRGEGGAPAAHGAGGGEAGSAAGRASGAAAGVGAGAGSTTVGAAPVAGDPAQLALAGPLLGDALLREVAALLKADDDALAGLRSESHLALSDLGLDSLLLAQLAGVLTHEYGFVQLRDEMLFGEYCSVDWLVARAHELRGALPLAPEALAPLAGVVGRAAAGAGEPGATPAAAAAAAAAAVVAAAPRGQAPLPVEIDAGEAAHHGVAEVGLIAATHSRHGHPAGRRAPRASWFTANCPCCLLCC